MKPIIATIAAIAFTVSPAIIENHIVPRLEALIQALISHI
jgi:hypothetical protein